MGQDGATLVLGTLRVNAMQTRSDEDQRSPDETDRLFTETIKRMIATPPKKHRDEPKRRRKSQPNPGKRGA